MKINFFEKFLGSGFYSGFTKKAPGTIASAFAYLLFLIPGFENPTFLLLLISFLIAFGKDIAEKFEHIYGHDPKECTIDELIGSFISLLFLPKKIWFIIPAFLVWRLLDIIKPFPANKFDKLSGGWSILLDDIFAGLYTFIIMQLSIMLINYFSY